MQVSHRAAGTRRSGITRRVTGTLGGSWLGAEAASSPGAPHGMGASQAAASWPQAGCFTEEKIKPKKLNLTNKTSPTPERFCFSGVEMERQTNKWAASCSLAHPHTATTGRTRTHPAEPLPAVSQAHSSRDKWECSRTQTRPPIRNGAPQAAS